MTEAEKGGWRTLARLGIVVTIVAGLIGILGFFLSEYRESTRRENGAVTAAPQAFAPPEETFIVSPVSWGRDLTVTVRKARTGYKGNIVVFWCNPANGHYGWIGEAAFGSPSDDYVMGSEYDTDNILIGINVNPEDGDPKTVISAWDLKKPRQTKPPQARPGTLQCIDFAGEH
jgi:hypothetical protein